MPLRKLYLPFDIKDIGSPALSQVTEMCRNLKELALSIISMEDKEICCQLVRQASNLTHLDTKCCNGLVSSEERKNDFIQFIFINLRSNKLLQEVSVFLVWARSETGSLDKVAALAKEHLRLEISLKICGKYI